MTAFRTVTCSTQVRKRSEKSESETVVSPGIPYCDTTVSAHAVKERQHMIVRISELERGTTLDELSETTSHPEFWSCSTIKRARNRGAVSV